ncbi:hypothetical protein [Luteimonas sp. gir]|uniref:hypothetical protein n=1 Tax=Luteimonas sp. gir TaxID=3127960 RepID=UPI003075B74E
MGKYGSGLLALANVWLALASTASVQTKLAVSSVGKNLTEHWLEYYGVLVLLGFGLLLLKCREQRLQKKQLLKYILDTAVEHDLPDGQYDDHECKATLYRYRRFSPLATLRYRLCWGRWRHPWSGWLIPVLRSGQSRLRPASATVFRADTVGASVHGITGGAWAKGFYYFRAGEKPADGRKHGAYERNLPKMMLLTQQEYEARKRSGHSLSRYIYGGRIEVGNRIRWGVLVVDTSVEPAIAKGNKPTRTDLLMLGMLSRAIEWGEL